MRSTLENYEYNDATVTIEYNTGLAVGAEHLVIVDGPDYLINRSFYFDEFNEQYAKNFATKVVDDHDYRQRCLDRTVDWSQVADIYEEASRRVYQQFESTEGGLLGYTVGDNAEKQRYQQATNKMEQLCQEIFSEIKRQVRDSASVPELDEFVDDRVAEARRAAHRLDPHEAPDLALGDRVEDIEQESSIAVVVGLPDETIAEHTISDGTTVYEYNEEYPPETPVALVAFEDDLATLDEWMSLESEEIQDALVGTDIETYSYPAARLQPIDDRSQGRM